ncbi:MAG TPA: hypothetical protein VLI92_00825 [Candidatus Saccharimonadales bacterium]|nr:hypothetical protein [Candidatus Saccharimonadales bacterium]
MLKEKFYARELRDMTKSREELEDILPESSTQLVSLNTRVPQFVDKLINECVGILQTTSPYLKFTKQSAVQVLIERGYLAIREEFERQDLIEESSGENIASIKQATKAKSSINLQAYHEMSNKNFYEPRSQLTIKAKPESEQRIKQSLGID